jgi:hypothetical protein
MLHCYGLNYNETPPKLGNAQATHQFSMLGLLRGKKTLQIIKILESQMYNKT